MKTAQLVHIMCFSFLLSSCATHDPVAERNAGERHYLAHGGKEWQAKFEKMRVHPKGLIWRAEGKPEAVLVCLHGIQTHSAWFGPLAAELNKAGWTVIAPDRRGSGLNSDKPFLRGHTKGEKELMDDLQAQIQAARKEAKNTPVYLLGTSWGSNLAGAYVSQPNRDKPNGLIQLVPATEVRKSHTPGLLGKLLLATSNFVAPKTTTRLQFGPQHYLAGHDQATIRDAKCNLPLVPSEGEKPEPPELKDANLYATGILEKDRSEDKGALLERPTVRTLFTGNKLNKKWLGRARELERSHYPVLVITADHDQIMDNQKALTVFENPGLGSIATANIKAGHAAQITHPEEVADAIVKWAQK